MYLTALSIADGKALGKLYPLVARGQTSCQDEYHEKCSGGVEFICTREKDHTGPHVAHIPGGDVVAMWGDMPTTWAHGPMPV